MLVAAGLAACGDDVDPSTFPDGATLISESATAMAALQTVRFEVTLDPPIGDVPLAKADVTLTDKGESAGDVQVVMGGQLVGVSIVVTADGTSYLKFPGTNWAQANLLADVYDTTAILDPERGVAKLLSTATSAQTTGSEKANGIDSWKVEVHLSTEVVERLVPAQMPDEGITGTVWIDKSSKRLVKATISAPATEASEASEIVFSLSDFDKPADISAPTN